MPSRPDPTRGPEVHAVMSRLVLAHGVPGLSLRAIATDVGIAASTLVAQFSHRRRLLTWFCAVTGRRRTQERDRWVELHGLGGLLPRDQAALDLESVWWGVVDLARTNEDIAEIAAGQDDDGRDLVRYVLAGRERQRGRDVSPASGWRADPDEVEVLACLLEGLRLAMVRSSGAMSLEEGTRLLEWAAVRLERLETSPAGEVDDAA